MKRKYSIGLILAAALFASVMVAPGGASATGGAQGSASNIGIQQCLPGWVGTWPNCKKPCPKGWSGSYWPGCRPPCPTNWSGTFWPNCHPPCPKGWTGGFWPNCKPPKCPPGMIPPYCEKPPKQHMRKMMMATRPPGG